MKNYNLIFIFLFFSFVSYSQSTVNEQMGYWDNPSHWTTTIAGNITGSLLNIGNRNVYINGTTVADMDLYINNTALVINPQDTLIISGYLYGDNFSYIENNGTLIVLGDVYTNWFTSIVNNGKFVSTGNVGGWNWGSDPGDSYVYGNRAGVNPVGAEGNESDLQSSDPDLYNYVESMVTILPVELLSFNVSTTNEKVLVQWSTANEKNNDYFAVLRSKDATNWEIVGEVPGNGITSNIINYSFEDDPINSGVYYYRIKQVDFNGNSEQFSVKRVEYNTNSVEIYPNPFMDHLAINKSFDNLIIFDESGKIQFESDKNFSGGLEIQTNNWKKGLYIVKIISGEGTITKKIFK
ncbi:T9SS type A sorting domain-containing protein [Mangrovivirga cuniculi]|uniref:Secretion system C-terminal sorting domain-containing protein n=1 Tax=Mangrovivirga cuniculi TaxID=2715131 RepID=A0A4D7JGR1_9BACT|nr:T9SS type A sorting domain-containing protein [Mangrovivirga cuniculi]QCK15309.1 hypothetical protein DCC35_11415 [Mangrovivirga cuniculi]